MTDHYILKRIFESDAGIFGVLLSDKQPLCCTLEPPYLNNKPSLSSILAGIYDVVPHSGEKFKDVWELKGVKGRTAILLHAGNTKADTHGCILVGTSFFKNGVLQSQEALAKLRKNLPDNFVLEIQDCF